MKLTKLACPVSLLIVGLGLSVNGYSQSFLTNGLVAYYPFNGNANDASGNGNNGIVHGTVPSTDRFGVSSSAYNFYGSNWIMVPYSPSLYPQVQTISIWLNMAPFPDDTVYVGANVIVVLSAGSRDPWRGYGLGNYNFNKMFGFTDLGGSNYAIQIGLPNASWPTNQWYQMTYVRTTNTARLFRNGQLVAQATGLVPNAVPQSSDLFIGANANANDETVSFYSGALDELRIYNRAFSDSEVEQLYAYESGPEVDLIKAVKPSFRKLALTTNYQMQISADLRTWSNYGASFTATNTTMIYPQYFDVDNWNSLFFRVQSLP